MRQNYTISIPVKTFWKFVVPASILLGTIGMLAGAIIVDRVIMPRVVKLDRGVVEVPSLEDLPWTQARQKLFDLGLRCQVTGRSYNDEVEEDHILSQNPAAGTMLDKAERRGVQVVVSKGPEIARVPTVRGLGARGARRKLRKHGFAVGTVYRHYSGAVPKDKVMFLKPEPGAVVSREVPIDITVSKGPEPTHGEVPNLIGETLAAAKAQIRESGLKLGSVKTAHSATLDPGTIMSQSVPPGTTVPFESAVNVVVASGK